MYLASHLGCPSPLRMLREMAPRDLALWRAYFEDQPFGEHREDLRHGIRAALFAQANSRPGKKYRPQDFIPGHLHEKPQGVHAMMAMAAALTEELGGVVRAGALEEAQQVAREDVEEVAEAIRVGII